MCPLLPFVCWHPQFSVNERCYGVTHTGQVLLIWHLQFSSFKFRNVLVPAETVILGSFGLIFGICKPFLTSDGKQDDASDMLQFSEVFRNGLNWAKKMIFWFILHLMRHIPKFCQIQDLIKIYIWSKFYQYSIWSCEMKDFKWFLYWFSIHEMSPFLRFFAPLLPQILFDLAETLTIGNLQ